MHAEVPILNFFSSQEKWFLNFCGKPPKDSNHESTIGLSLT